MRTIFSRGFVCAFPGVGKSHVYEDALSFGLVKGVNPEDINSLQFKQQFLKIKASASVPVFDNELAMFVSVNDYIKNAVSVARLYPEFLYFLSASSATRRVLKEAGIKYDIIYPKRELKDEYLKMYADQGRGKVFCDHIDKYWDKMIDSIESDQTIGMKYVLESGQKLSDVLL